MSDELAQDDEGFEIADFGADEDDDDENAAAHRGDRTELGQEGPRYDPAPTHHPAAKPIPRESLDGETIFAVGEDHEDADRWSEEGSDDGGKDKLVRRKESD